MEKTNSFEFAFNSSSISLFPNFILPEDGDDNIDGNEEKSTTTAYARPNLSKVMPLTTIPTIDMIIDHDSLVSVITKACEDFGFFQIINHGVPRDVYKKMMDVSMAFFRLPCEERGKLYSSNPHEVVRVGSGYVELQNKERVNLWMERLSHLAHPFLKENAHLLPQNPPEYREIAVEYAKEIADLVDRLWGLLSEGLGVEQDYMRKRFENNLVFQQIVNFYPPCPDPELTLGLPPHSDIGLITVLQQVEGVSGLQIFKDGKWLSVDPLPDALIINLGDQFEVLSNGRFKSQDHRAVNNAKVQRLSVVTHCKPKMEVVIGPIYELDIKTKQTPLYRQYPFEEYNTQYYKDFKVVRKVKELFLLNP
ncbi:hypothetical protein MKW92_047562 [Papaver armeniacum]|nr:hypothetical protein MKW92_047562 [Papaver armeniacum]